MFSSTCSNNGISFPAQLSSPCFNPAIDKEILLHHHHHHHHGCLNVAAPLIETAAKEMKLSTKSSTTATNPEIHRPNKFNCKKKVARKDGHSKIVTAQGPRGRRVRLSMDIARKFFDLQDLLGFDKASKTLDWLLTNSKTAIRELFATTDGTPKSLISSSSSSECEQVEFAARAKRASKRKRIQGPVLKCKAAKVATNCIDKLLAKESRANARERARERTKQKVWLRKLIGLEAAPAKKPPDLLTPNQPIKSWSHNFGSNCMTYSDQYLSTHNVNAGLLMDHELVDSTEEIFEESVMITRKMKPSSSIFGFQRNLIISKDASSCSNLCHWPPNSSCSTQNRDISSTITFCGLCAATTSMSSSKVLPTLREGFGYGGQQQQH